MKKFLIAALALTLTASLISACSNKLCPAYGSYPSKRGR